MFISVVIPVYKSEKTISVLVEKLKLELDSFTHEFEIILVDDCCPENSWKSIYLESINDKRVKGIKLSRNFGQHYAITAGLSYVKGEWIVIMDCDLQDNPEEIINLYNKAVASSSKIVFARRAKRNDNFLKRITSIYFYKVLSYLTDVKFDESVSNFGIFHSDVVNNYIKLNDKMRVFPLLINLLGFSVQYCDVQHNPREIGKSSYNFKKRFKLGFDIILSFSNKPLNLIMKAGVFISIISFLFAIYTIYRFIEGEIRVSGYTSILVSIWFLAGIIIFIIGFIGLYIGKIFDSVKNRPIFIVDELLNIKN